MCIFGSHTLWGRKSHKQNPPKNPGTIPRIFCLCVCLFVFSRSPITILHPQFQTHFQTQRESAGMATLRSECTEIARFLRSISAIAIAVTEVRKFEILEIRLCNATLRFEVRWRIASSNCDFRGMLMIWQRKLIAIAIARFWCTQVHEPCVEPVLGNVRVLVCDVVAHMYSNHSAHPA